MNSFTEQDIDRALSYLFGINYNNPESEAWKGLVAGNNPYGDSWMVAQENNPKAYPPRLSNFWQQCSSLGPWIRGETEVFIEPTDFGEVHR